MKPTTGEALTDVGRVVNVLVIAHVLGGVGVKVKAAVLQVATSMRLTTSGERTDAGETVNVKETGPAVIGSGVRARVDVGN